MLGKETSHRYTLCDGCEMKEACQILVNDLRRFCFTSTNGPIFMYRDIRFDCNVNSKLSNENLCTPPFNQRSN